MADERMDFPPGDAARSFSLLSFISLYAYCVQMERFDSLKGKAFLFLLFLSSLWFLNFVGRTLFSPVLPLIEDEFHINHARASSIFIFQSLGYGISIFSSGLWSGLLGYKRSIVISLLVSALAFFMIPFSRAFSALYVFSFIIGLATGVYIPAVIPLITRMYDEKIWSKTIAIHDSAASIGVFGAPLIALGLLRLLQWRGMFAVLGLVFVCVAMVFFFLFDELKVSRITRAAFGDFITRRSLWVLSLMWVFAASTSLGIYSVIPLYLTKELNLDIGYANTIFGVSRLGGFVVAISSGFLVSRFSLRTIMFSMLLISGVFTIFVGLAGGGHIGVALFLQASFIYGFFPAGLIAISRMFDLHVRGIATGFIFGVGVIFGWGVAPYLLGLSGDLLSFRFGILILGALTMLSGGLVFLLRELRPEGKTQMPEASPNSL
jgi:MFS transporter, NNP family, nitrate/nitrite transporter